MRVNDEEDLVARHDPARAIRSSVLEAAAGVRQVQLALQLAESGVPFVIVGGTARLLRGEHHTPKDLDVLVRPTEAAQMHDVLNWLAVPSAPGGLRRKSPWTVSTSWSQVDVFVEDEPPTSRAVEVDGMELRVADE